MSERLNVTFSDESTGEPYCLLAVRDLDMESPVMPRLLTSLVETIEEQSQMGQPTISALAADVVRVLASQASADLLPPTSEWIAELTVNVRRAADEFRVSCKTMDFGAINEALAADLAGLDESPIESLNGFEGNAEQLRDLLDQVDWSDLDD
jgi:hypothetical protein